MSIFIRYLFLIAICLYLLSNVFSVPLLEVGISAISLLAVLCCVAFVNRIVLTFGTVFLSIGSIILISNNADWFNYLFAFGEMLNLLTLFALVPILALPIKLGSYARNVEVVIEKNIKSSGQLYMVSSGISYFLSSFMNLAALPMTYYSIRSSVDIFTVQNKERFLTRSITHGFAMPLLWTPVTPIVGIVIEMTGVSYSSILPILIPLSIIGLLLDWTMAQWNSKRSRGKSNYIQREIDQSKQELTAATSEKEDNHLLRLSHILVAIILLNVVIVITEQFIDVSFLFLISLLVIPFSFSWTLLLRKHNEYFKALKGHFQTHLGKMKDQFFLFLTAGFFISALNISGVDENINDWLSGVIDMVGVQLFLVILPFVPLILAFLGLHPAVAFVLIVEAINHEVLGVSPLVMTIAMLGSAVPAFLMGPYNATLGVMSNIINENPFKISNWNKQFGFVYMAGVIVFLQIAQYVL